MAVDNDTADGLINDSGRGLLLDAADTEQECVKTSRNMIGATISSRSSDTVQTPKK